MMLSLLAVVLIAPLYDLQGAVDRAVRSGENRLVLPQGVVRVNSPADYALEVQGLKGFTIEGKGTTLLLERPNQGLATFRDCDRLSLLGFTVQHLVPSMTQGWIRSVSSDKSTYEVEIMPGYLAGQNVPQRPVGYIFDPKTRNWREGSIDLYFEKVTQLGGRRIRVEIGRPMQHAVSVGDLMAFRGSWRTEIQLQNCARTRVDGLTLQSSPGFGIQESGGEGGSFYRYRVLRGPIPAGATMAPLLSSNADAFHSNGVRKGPRVEGCRFEYMADDGVPIHGNYLGVASANKRQLVLAAPWNDEWFRVGDRIRLYNQKLTESLTQGELPRVVAFRAVTDPKVSTSTHRPLAGKSIAYEVTLDRDVQGIVPDSLSTNAECQGDGFLVRGNTIINNRARGMLVTASNGTIENNTIDGSTIAGIVLSPELYWLQSDFSNNVVIRGNTIRNTGRATVGSWSNQVGGIVLSAEVSGGRLHRNIRIENNVFEGIFGPAIVIRHASAVTLKNNRFRGLRSVVNGAGSNHGIPAAKDVFIDDADVIQ